MRKLLSFQFARFFSVSVVNLLVDLLFIALLVEVFRIPDRLTDMMVFFPSVSQGEFLTRVIAFSLTFIIAFNLQSKFTFKQKKFHAAQLKKYFVVTAGVSVWQLFSFPLFLQLLKILMSHNGQASLPLFYMSVIMAGATAMIISYSINRLWTFKEI